MYEELIKNLRKMQSHEYCVLVSIDSFPAMQIVKQAADAIEELQGELQALKDDTDMAIVEDGKTTKLCFTKKWIPVTERLPEENGHYLVHAVGNGYYSTYIALWNGRFRANFEMPITHWMPIPQPPESGDK